ncbi:MULTISPECIES: AraC family transcriptional regulator [Marinobacter]|uniref:AraC family transcriptional regulator n=1 Tax=Marinobacter xiaoshiensis TaxID=3073652 RepID=A0ABU2HKL6_9GAMM|nr:MULTISPECIES: AraC family transcriptional regulator [unclassified Marinobacter]MBK1874145.1 AraC family transcriptional regulator [Marinobacter sp. 1-3A]MBK1886728.1 AraC family transcriptional regulator [Marinobacter sp. DY40_1A1]MDS1311617.1 AraC family transcriptional regulator [Marinobacter sp. F60267]
MQELRDAGVMLRLIYEAMKKKGLDTDLVFSRLGVNAEYVYTEQLRTPHSAQMFFWQAVEDVSGDPDIGLHLGQLLPVYKGQVLEYLFLSSPTFGEGLRRAQNYQRLLSDAANTDFFIEGEEACMVLDTASDEVRRLRHFNECFVQGLLTFFRSITDNEFRPSRVEFEHDREEGREYVAELLGCDVVFGADENRLYFPVSLLSHPSPHAEPELLDLHERFASEQVARLEKKDIVGQVERIIAELLDSGEVTLDSVATRLDIKPRTLRTRLTEAETSFNQVLADFRYRLARQLLATTDESIDEIVYLTGFSEPSTFYRAFKRWSGMTPIEYRKTAQGKDAMVDAM